MVVLSPMIISCRTTPLVSCFAGYSLDSFGPFGDQGKRINVNILVCKNSCVSYPLLNRSRTIVYENDARSRCSAAVGNGGGGGGGNDGNSGGGGGRGDENGGDSKWFFISWYLSLLQKHPVLTKAVTSAILTFIGDIICQVMIDHVPSLDLKRTFVFTLLGLVLVGPTLHFWYMYLSKLVSVTGGSGAFMRLLLDQCVFSPIFIGVFMTALLILEGRSSQVVPKLQQEWFSSLLANWQLWIPFQFVNFRFVPQQFQVLFANIIALVWNVILSYKAHKAVKSE